MFSISQVPKLSDASSAVKVLQDALIAKGYNPGTADGIFGAKTAKAVSLFQKEVVKTPGTGVVGPKTLAALGISLIPTDPVTMSAALTKEIAGSSRNLHPTMRLLIEAKVFPNGKIEGAHWMKETADIAECAEQVLRAMADLKIWEKGGNNKGEHVGMIQGVTGSYVPGGNGDAWCEDWDQVKVAFIEDCFQEKSPMPATAGVMDCLAKSKRIPGMISKVPLRGTTMLAEHGSTGKGHCMPIVEVIDEDDVLTCEGNTSVSNIRDGDGSGLKNRKTTKNGDLVTRGFVFVYPYGQLPSKLKGAANEPEPKIQQPVQQKPAPSAPVGARIFKAAWDGKAKDASLWTGFIVEALEELGEPLLALRELKDQAEFCPKWPLLNREERIAVMVMMISSMAKPESNFKPDCTYTESFADRNGKKVISRGLLQVSIESSNSYGAGLKNANELHDPRTNLRVGVMILNRWLGRDVYFGKSTGGKHLGGARYWSCLRDARPSRKQIVSNVKALSETLG